MAKKNQNARSSSKGGSSSKGNNSSSKKSNKSVNVSFENKTKRADRNMETKPHQGQPGESWWKQRSAQKHTERMANVEKGIKNSQEVQKTARTTARSMALSNAVAKYSENLNGGFIIGEKPPAPDDQPDGSADMSGQNGSNGKGSYQKTGGS